MSQFTNDEEDAAFKVDPAGDPRKVYCSLCEQTLQVLNRSVRFTCVKHTKGKRHQAKVRIMLAIDPNITPASFKYEDWLTPPEAPARRPRRDRVAQRTIEDKIRTTAAEGFIFDAPHPISILLMFILS